MPYGTNTDQSVFAKAESSRNLVQLGFKEPRVKFQVLLRQEPSQDRSMNPSGWLEAYNAKIHHGSFKDFKDMLVILGVALLVVPP